MSEVRFVDTTLRDGQMCLWATNMTTGMIEPILDRYDAVGFDAMEITGAAFFKKQVRELREDPFARIRLARKFIRQTRLRSIRNRYMASFSITPWAISDLWVERLAAAGVDEVRASDPTNTPAMWERIVNPCRQVGIDCIINVTYSVSPRHTNAYYAEKIRAAAKLDVKRICFKDPGGLLTPERTRELAPIFLQNSGDKPVEIHSHTTAGFGPLVNMAAVQAGIHIINTAIPPLANGASLPSVYSTAANLRTLGFTPAIDVNAARPLTDHFTFIARRHGFPEGEPRDYDEFLYQHQLPGGMASNLGFQMAQVGQAHRLPEVLAETARVRADLGYPIMVTPYSQFVGVQAAINVMLGERYKEVTDQIIEYALGHWGEEERDCIDPDVRDRILARPRARELAKWVAPETTVAELRRTLGGAGVSDDDILLRYFTGAADVDAMRKLGPRNPAAVDATTPLSALIGEITQRSGIRQFSVQRGGFTLQLGKEGA